MAEAELDLHRLQALTRHWRESPPMHLLVKAYVGYEPPAPPSAEPDAEMAAVLRTTPVIQAARIDDSAWQTHRAPTP